MSEADIGSCLCVSENTCKCTFTTLEPKNLADCCGQRFPLLMLFYLMLSATWCHLFSPFLPLEWSQPCVPSSSCGWESGLSLLPCPSRGQRKVPSRQGQLCLFSVVDWFTALPLKSLEHRDLFPSNLPLGWWSLGEGGAGSWGQLHPQCSEHHLSEIIKTGCGPHIRQCRGPVVPAVLFVTLRISSAVLQLGSGAAFSIWVQLHGYVCISPKVSSLGMWSSHKCVDVPVPTRFVSFISLNTNSVY